MEDRLVLLKLLFDAADEPIQVTSFNDRLRKQKICYLLQELLQEIGIPLGYRFGWYIRGPYSSQLTDDYFALDEQPKEEDDPKVYTLRSNVREKIQDAIGLFSPPDKEIPKEIWLEVLASLHYLKHYAYLPQPNKTFQNLFNQLISDKPHPQDYEGAAKTAWETLKKFDLVE